MKRLNRLIINKLQDNKEESLVKSTKQRYHSGLSRILASATLAIMLLSLFVMSATLPAVADTPAFSGGSGTAANPYQIKTAADLAAISNAPQTALYYILENDIDLSSNPNWTPINDGGNGDFYGHFDGNHHVIKNLTINDNSSGDTGVGLFGIIGGDASVKDLTLTNVNIQSTNSTCSIGSFTFSLRGSITGCSASGKITGQGTIGGLVGSTEGGSTMTNCSFSGSVSGGFEVGGLVGHHDGLMTGCYSHGSFSASGSSNGVGGLAGESRGNPGDGIVKCYSDASVSGTNGVSSIGGLVGDDYPGPMSNCYFAGRVSGSVCDNGLGIGGLVGRLSGQGTISNCYVAGPVSSDSSNYIGGLAGRNEGAISGCYWDQDITQQTGAAGFEDEGSSTSAQGESTAAMQQQATFSAWDFGSVWAVNEGSGYPYLIGVSGTGTQGGSTTSKVVKRLSGLTRIDTALAIAKAAYPGKVSNILLATADNYPDALAGSVLAYKFKSPILLVGSSDSDQASVLAYMKDNLDPAGTVYILGGNGAVSANLEAQIRAGGFKNITRLGGADRYATSVQITEAEGITAGSPVVLVSGDNYPDALSVSSAAAMNQYPILLVSKDGVSDTVKQEIAKIKPGKVYIIGLQGVIGTSVEDQLAQANIAKANIVRIGGIDRVATSLAAAQYFNLPGSIACVATGNDFPDALAGSAYAALNKAPVLLVGDSLTDNQIAYLKNGKLTGATIFGGEGAVSHTIEEQLVQVFGQ